MTHRRSAALTIAILAASACTPAELHLDLVRCANGSDVPCLRTRETIAGQRITVAAGTDGIAGLGRTTARRGLMRDHAGDAVIRAVAAWRPPLLAMPAFRGVADSAALSPALQEALILGGAVGSDRPAIALLVAVLLVVAWLLVIRLESRDREPEPARDRSNTARTGPPDASFEEGPPRKPDDVTHQTARGTAHRR